MPSVNKAIILGHLGADPEARETGGGMAVCTMRVATSEKFKDGERTEWHTIVAFGRTAELCRDYLKKGRAAYFEGRIQTDKWQDKEGKDRYTTKIVADRVQFLGGKRDEGDAVPVPDAAPDADSIPF